MRSLSSIQWNSGIAILAVLAVLLRTSDAAETKIIERPFRAIVKNASGEAQKALKKFSIPSGLEIEVFAAEPMLANPVAFCVDHLGRFYVAETFRLHKGVTDMRNHKKWLDDDLACRTVEDRLNAMRKNLKFDFTFYALQHDRVRRIEDRNGDGHADYATVFADGFSHSVDGIGAGLLADRGNVYYTCIPHLWLLHDKNDDGVADDRKSLSTGYGVHINFLGHDLHGLRKGPDGRIYFSIGDRGSYVKTENGVIDYPDAGAVFRCEPDGSGLEIFHRGLRNPQELVFDDYGNLFTGDNNSDAGDKARWVYCVEGGDSGWQIGYQWIEKPVARGPWNAESMWYPQWKGQAAYILPPITNITSGPSGLAYYPGTGLPDSYKGHFFLCDFRGAAASSLIHTFALQPKGATFELVDRQEFLKGSLVTDVDFGMDGGIYFTDWVQGWNLTGQGRIYHVFNREIDESPIVKETKKLLAEGMEKRTNDELAKLLEHPDQRVRFEAQWALADRGKDGLSAFSDIVKKSKIQLARLHSIWGIGQIVRYSKPPQSAQSDAKDGTSSLAERNTATDQQTKDGPAKTDLLTALMLTLVVSKGISEAVSDAATQLPFFGFSLLSELVQDSDPEVRAQAINTIGDCFHGEVFDLNEEPQVGHDPFELLLKDPSPRVRFFAAMTLGKLRATALIEPILDMLRENADADPYLRHAGVSALVEINSPKALIAKSDDESPAVRMGILLALRRLHRPEVSRFLKDPDPLLVVEAARAINDFPIEGALPELAAMAEGAESIVFAAETGIDAKPLLLRILNANFRLGRAEGARAIAGLAASDRVADEPRLEALGELRDWAKPSGRDRVIGVWRPLPDQVVAERKAEDARHAIRVVAGDLLKAGSTKIAQATAELAGQYKLAEVAPILFDIVSTKEKPTEVRVAALRALGKMRDANLSKAIFIAQNDEIPSLRTEGNAQLAKLDPNEAVRVLSEALDHGSILEKQGALNALGEMKNPQSDLLLVVWLEKLIAGQAMPEIQLELIEAAKPRQSAIIREMLERYEKSMAANDPLAGHRGSLAGGQAERGARVFFEKVEAQCQKCHTVKGKGGGEVGPDLSDIGSRKPREYILNSIVHPNSEIAQGFENVTILTTDGKEYTGRVLFEDAEKMELELPVQEEAEDFIEDGATSPESKKSPDAIPPKPPEPQTPKYTQITLPKNAVKSRQHNLSSMPEELVENLSSFDLRDLVEYLSGLK